MDGQRDGSFGRLMHDVLMVANRGTKEPALIDLFTSWTKRFLGFRMLMPENFNVRLEF